MANIFAWILFALGIVHIAFGMIRFKAPFFDAVKAGFVGQFGAPEERRTAFWFLVFGPQVMLAGQVAVHAVAINDLWLLRLVGFYVLAVSAVGIAAFPRSPFWATLIVSPVLIGASYGLI